MADSRFLDHYTGAGRTLAAFRLLHRSCKKVPCLFRQGTPFREPSDFQRRCSGGVGYSSNTVVLAVIEDEHG